MGNIRNATFSEKVRLFIYRYSLDLVSIVSIALSCFIIAFGLLPTILENAVTLSVTGVAVASFLFTVQSIFFAIPSDNAFMKAVRDNGYYIAYIHRFCRRSELIFLLLLIPMLYMPNAHICLNLFLISGYICALIFTIWAMALMGKILIISERHF